MRSTHPPSTPLNSRRRAQANDIGRGPGAVRAPGIASARTAPVVWLTGLPSSGKSTIGKALVARLRSSGKAVEYLDGDEVRSVFPSTSFKREARDAHVRMVGFAASLLARHRVTVVCALISPFEGARNEVHRLCDEFIEVYVFDALGRVRTSRREGAIRAGSRR